MPTVGDQILSNEVGRLLDDYRLRANPHYYGHDRLRLETGTMALVAVEDGFFFGKVIARIEAAGTVDETRVISVSGVDLYREHWHGPNRSIKFELLLPEAAVFSNEVNVEADGLGVQIFG